MANIINFAAFQLGWFACVLGAAQGLPWLGPLVVALYLPWHLYQAQRRPTEAMVLLLSLIIGLVWESLLSATSLVHYTGQVLGANIAPAWIVAMWALFGTTINYSMGWLRGHYWLAALMGGVFGPMAFVAGERLQAVTLPQGWLSWVLLSLGWALLLPMLLKLSANCAACRSAQLPIVLRQ